MLRSALTAAGLLLTAAVAAADDPARHLGTYKPKDDDTQTVGGYHRYRGFYPGGFYGGGFNRGFYGGGFYGGGWGGYRPGFGWGGVHPGFGWGGSSFYYSQRFYAPPVFYRPAPAFGFGWYGCADTPDRPTVSLTLALRPGVPVLPPPTAVPPAAVPDGTFRYDGGPARPVPMPPADAELPAVRSGLPGVKNTDTLFIAMTKPAAPAKPASRYPAYGEKR